MKFLISLLFCVLSSVGVSTAVSDSIEATHSAAVEIRMLEKNNTTFFHAPVSGEVLFMQKGDATVEVLYQPGNTIRYSIDGGFIEILNGTTLVQRFTNSSSGEGTQVLSVGLQTIAPGDQSDDVVTARDCGCFTADNPPPKKCDNDNPELSTGCSSGGSASAGVTIMGNGGSGGGGNSCSVQCNADLGAYPCCIRRGKF